MSNIQDLFKTPIYETLLNLNNEKMVDYCISLSKKDKGLKISNFGGWQSKPLVGIHKPLNDLLKSIDNHTNKFIKNIGLKYPLKIDNLWININEYKDFNMIHHHANSKISGVYYIQTPKDCGNIVFHHPCFELFECDWNNKTIDKFNSYNSSRWWLPSEAGWLYLFPGWLNHYVQPNLNKKEKRISISFNLV